MKILLAADGSDYTKSAARSLAEFVPLFKTLPQVPLLHVRLPFLSRRRHAWSRKAVKDTSARRARQRWRRRKSWRDGRAFDSW